MTVVHRLPLELGNLLKLTVSDLSGGLINLAKSLRKCMLKEVVWHYKERSECLIIAGRQDKMTGSGFSQHLVQYLHHLRTCS